MNFKAIRKHSLELSETPHSTNQELEQLLFVEQLILQQRLTHLHCENIETTIYAEKLIQQMSNDPIIRLDEIQHLNKALYLADIQQQCCLIKRYLN